MDAELAIAHLDAGLERAKRRTTRVAAVERAGVQGVYVVANADLAGYAAGRFLPPDIIEILPGTERVLEHEAQHLIAYRLGARGACFECQDHGVDSRCPQGGYDLDCRR